jgi:hypothetical protein
VYVLPTCVRAEYVRTCYLISSKLYSHNLHNLQHTPRLRTIRLMPSSWLVQASLVRLRALHRLRQDKRKLVFSAQMLQHDFLQCYSLAQPEVAYIDVP